MELLDRRSSLGSVVALLNERGGALATSSRKLLRLFDVCVKSANVKQCFFDETCFFCSEVSSRFDGEHF